MAVKSALPRWASPLQDMERGGGPEQGPGGREVLLLPSRSTVFRVMNSKALEQLQDSAIVTPPPAGIAKCLEKCWVLYMHYLL